MKHFFLEATSSGGSIQIPKFPSTRVAVLCPSRPKGCCVLEKAPVPAGHPLAKGQLLRGFPFPLHPGIPWAELGAWEPGPLKLLISYQIQGNVLMKETCLWFLGKVVAIVPEGLASKKERLTDFCVGVPRKRVCLTNIKRLLLTWGER